MSKADTECFFNGKMMQQSVCYKNCPSSITRSESGAAACLAMVLEEPSCGNKWLEVGNNKCYCYASDMTECDEYNDGGEDLYEIK